MLEDSAVFAALRTANDLCIAAEDVSATPALKTEKRQRAIVFLAGRAMFGFGLENPGRHLEFSKRGNQRAMNEIGMTVN